MRISPTALPAHLSHLSDGWQIIAEHHLERTYTFPDFKQALDFTNRVGAFAEQDGHHPDIHLSWGKVRLELWTHSVDGLTNKDFEFAAKLDKLS